MKKMRYGLLLMVFCSFSSMSTIGINSMVEFTQDGDAQFTISNGDDYRQFISVAISSIKIEDGELVKTPYSRENINTWSLTAHPARTVIDAKRSKDFKLTYQPLPSDSEERDKMYQISFIPTPYFTEGDPAKHRVQVAIGFAVYVIVPAQTDQPFDYDVTYNGDSIQLNNHGNSYIRAYFDACPDSVKGDSRKACSKVMYAMPGRRLNVPLTEEMQKKAFIKAELSTHYLTYKDKWLLPKEKTITSKD